MNIVNSPDEQLLTEAANAVGLMERQADWDPLVYDDQAFRLAIDLQFDVNAGSACSSISYKYEGMINSVGTYERHVDHVDKYAATRRAIVRGAAYLGRNKA